MYVVNCLGLNGKNSLNQICWLYGIHPCFLLNLLWARVSEANFIHSFIHSDQFLCRRVNWINWELNRSTGRVISTRPGRMQVLDRTRCNARNILILPSQRTSSLHASTHIKYSWERAVANHIMGSVSSASSFKFLRVWVCFSADFVLFRCSILMNSFTPPRDRSEYKIRKTANTESCSTKN